MGSLFMKLSQSNFNLRLPDCYLVRSYLIATVFLLMSAESVQSSLQQQLIFFFRLKKRLHSVQIFCMAAEIYFTVLSTNDIKVSIFDWSAVLWLVQRSVDSQNVHLTGVQRFAGKREEKLNGLDLKASFFFLVLQQY